MPRYENGRAPLSDLVKLADKHYLPIGTCARWRELQRLGWEKYGVWLEITPGWNGYRPLDIQIEYREELGIWAAIPGTSSHGLTYQGRDCAAIDVNNWRALAPGNQSLAWARFVALCRTVGFTVDFVTPREEWHIGDFDPYVVPSFASITINPATTSQPNHPSMSEEDEMLALRIDAGPRGVHLCTLGNGVFRHLIADDNPERVKNVIRSDDQWTDIGIHELNTYLWTYGCRTDIHLIAKKGNGFEFQVKTTDENGVYRSGGMWHR